MDQRLQGLFERLHEKEYKLTPQRRVVMKAFLNHSEDHLSADEVYNLVKQDHPEIGLATIYRTLDLLAEIGILQKLDFGDGRGRYELTGGREEHHHHHLICLSCGKVIGVEDDLLESLEALISRKTGFRIIDHDVKFYGHCRDCLKSKASGHLDPGE